MWVRASVLNVCDNEQLLVASAGVVSTYNYGITRKDNVDTLFSHQKRMFILLCQHVTDINPALDLSPNSFYRQNSLFPMVAI